MDRVRVRAALTDEECKDSEASYLVDMMLVPMELMPDKGLQRRIVDCFLQRLRGKMDGLPLRLWHAFAAVRRRHYDFIATRLEDVQGQVKVTVLETMVLLRSAGVPEYLAARVIGGGAHKGKPHVYVRWMKAMPWYFEREASCSFCGGDAQPITVGHIRPRLIYYYKATADEGRVYGKVPDSQTYPANILPECTACQNTVKHVNNFNRAIIMLQNPDRGAMLRAIVWFAAFWAPVEDPSTDIVMLSSLKQRFAGAAPVPYEQVKYYVQRFLGAFQRHRPWVRADALVPPPTVEDLVDCLMG